MAVTGTLDLSMLLDAALTGHPVLRLLVIGAITIDYGVILASTAPVTTGDTYGQILDQAIVDIGIDALKTALDMRRLNNEEQALIAAAPSVTEPAESAAMYAFILRAFNGDITPLADYETAIGNIRAGISFTDWDRFITHLMLLCVKLMQAQPHLKTLTGE